MNILQKIIALTAIVLSTATTASVPNWPNQPVQIIVPIDSGTLHDVVARRLATELSAKWRQPVTVLNQPGASGAIGVQAVANGSADGHTLGIVGGTFTGVLATRPNPPYNRDSVVGVTKFARQNFLIFASSNAPFNNIQEMIAYAKANPGKLDYASPGTGSMVHITMEHLARTKNLQMTHVPYRGIMQAAPDVVSGRVHTMITSLNPTLDGLITKGDMKIIGSISESIVHNNKTVPTLNSIAPGVQASGYFAVIAPKGTPNVIIKRIQKDVADVVSAPEFAAALTAMSVPPNTVSTTDFDRWIDVEIARLKTIVKDINLKLD